MLLDRASDVFGSGTAPAQPAVDVKALHAKTGQLKLESDSLEGVLDKAGLLSAAMIDRNHPLPLKRQAELVGISRGTVYYQPEPISDADLRLMRRLDELHLEHPFAGAQMLRDMLAREENRQQVDAFYRAALEAGGKDNGRPGLRPHYHANYYAAFVIGPDGHNIEVVCHEPEA